jgi:hypothetical protein
VVGGFRNVLGGIGLVAGAVTAIVGLISFLADVSFAVFLFWVGIAVLAMAGVALVFLVSIALVPADQTRTGEVPAKSSGSVERVLRDAARFVFSAVGGVCIVTVVVEAIELAVGRTESFDLGRSDVAALGFVSLFATASGILYGWRDIVAFIRQSSKSSRSCPRCGHSVQAGVMKCPHCKFDFWSIGREAG